MDNEFGQKTSTAISTHEFLDFLKISCQLQESIGHRNIDDNSENEIDYNSLAKNDLVNALMNAKLISSPKTDSGENNGANERNGKSINALNQKFALNSISFDDKQRNQLAVIARIAMASQFINRRRTTHRMADSMLCSTIN